MSATVKNPARSSRAAKLADAAGKILSSIDSIEQYNTGRRNSPSIEMSDEDSQLRDRRRLIGAALGRDLQRNVSMWRGMMRQFEVSVVGAKGPKLLPAPPDDTAEKWCVEAADFFRDWEKWCDGIDDTPFAEMVSQALTAGKREGDILWVFDDFLRDDGTIRVYESDQMPTINAKDWETEGRKDRRMFPWKERNPDYKRGQKIPKYVPMIQKNGVVRDRLGRVHYYVVTSEHGKSTVEMSKVSIVAAWNPRRNPSGSAKLYKNQWRKSYRGSADATAVSSMQHDVYEMITHALASAKRAHQIAGWTETDIDSGLDPTEQALLRAGIDPEKVLALAEKAAADGTEVTVEALDQLLLSRNYESMEKLTGGYWEYPNAGEKLHLEGTDQPSPNLEPFAEFLQGASGYAMGLGRSRALGHAATAYTAFRGEEIMSWATFYADQKRLERRLLDFVVYKSLSWAVAAGEISPPPPGQWHRWFRWDWPVMPEVDVQKYANSLRTLQKVGKLDFSEMLGPDWKKKLEAYAAQIELIRTLDLPLAILETVSGSIIEEDAVTTTEDSNDE